MRMKFVRCRTATPAAGPVATLFTEDVLAAYDAILTTRDMSEIVDQEKAIQILRKPRLVIWQ